LQFEQKTSIARAVVIGFIFAYSGCGLFYRRVTFLFGNWNRIERRRRMHLADEGKVVCVERAENKGEVAIAVKCDVPISHHRGTNRLLRFGAGRIVYSP